MIKKEIEKVLNRDNLSIEESYEVMQKIMGGEINDSQIAALLIALKGKGESSQEIAGFAKAMRDRSIKIESDSETTIDVCGTGGDNSGTFNISTAASFVVAGAGVKVAKHGNRSISSLSGSADVLTELGISINLSPEVSEKAIDEIGIAFLFAPNYHPAMKHVAKVRKELGMKTIFNMLGPLTNPANTKKQLIGTFNETASQKMSKAVEYLNMKKVCFVCTDNKYDEILLSGTTKVFEFGNDKVDQYNLTSENFGLGDIEISNLRGNTSSENAEIILNILKEKEKSERSRVVIANAAMGLYCSGISNDLKECYYLAEESIESGKAYEKLAKLSEVGE
ncbi:MAG: anthranilate phosphoribosyltransferase [Melioribacteraceae bacterium]|nr:anthranilate phosphoribosyltransferase [Melioribacteraceae bacterium]